MDSSGNFGKSFGVMQGRLSKLTSLGYQAFPMENWKNEFQIAEKLGLQHIEWIFDKHSPSMNPILDSVELPNFLIHQKVKVISVCGDYFMDHQIHSGSIDNIQIFQTLLVSLQNQGINMLILPFVDQSSAVKIYGLTHLIDTLNMLDNMIEKSNVKIALETDLNPLDFKRLLNSINTERYCVNYDIGNSASLGYNFEEEIRSYGDFIKILHIKDRKLHGSSVQLGLGDAQIREILVLLLSRESEIITTLQCYRDEEGIKILEEQISYLRLLFKNL